MYQAMDQHVAMKKAVDGADVGEDIGEEENINHEDSVVLMPSTFLSFIIYGRILPYRNYL